MTISRALAETRLRKRYRHMVTIYPTMASDLPLSTYIAANVELVAARGLLADYDREPNWHPDRS